MKKTIIRGLLLSTFGLLIFNALFYTQQSGMLFYPYKALNATPDDWGLAFDNVELITADNVRLHGWYLPVKNSNKVLLFFHGNAGNISHRGESLEIFHQLGLNVLIIDYRGYGLSQGDISEQGMYKDAQAAWQYLIKQRGYKPEEITIFGRSLGGAVATQLASHVQPGALIVESTFSSARDMANIMMPLFSRLIFLRYEFDTESAIRQVTSPVLVMHSPEDEIVPYELGLKVFVAANLPKYSYELSGGHNDGFVQSLPTYLEVIKTFLQLPKSNRARE